MKKTANWPGEVAASWQKKTTVAAMIDANLRKKEARLLVETGLLDVGQLSTSMCLVLTSSFLGTATFKTPFSK